MKSFHRFYGIVFLYHGLLFALSFVLIEWALAAAFTLENFLFRILIFGTIEYLIFTGYRKPRLKFYGVQDLVIEDFYTTQQREVSSAVSGDEFRKKLKEDPELDRMEVHPTQTGIDLISAALVDLPGKKVSIDIEDKAPGLTRFNIKVRPKSGFFIFDNGKSKELLEHLERLLEDPAPLQEQPV